MTAAAHILLVEDDPDICRVVAAYLQHQDFTVYVEHDGLAGLECALEEDIDLIVLDWMLPHLDGLEFLRHLRKKHRTPVIMLTARGEEQDRIAGFEAGVDDYVTKPFSPRELVERVKAVLRRSQAINEAADSETTLLERGMLRMDSSSRQVWRDNQEINLSALEFDLLFALARVPGRVFTRDELLNRVWGEDFVGVERVVDVHISNLRQKLEPDISHPSCLLTVRGVGYKFAEDIL